MVIWIKSCHKRMHYLCTAMLEYNERIQEMADKAVHDAGWNYASYYGRIDEPLAVQMYVDYGATLVFLVRRADYIPLSGSVEALLLFQGNRRFFVTGQDILSVIEQVTCKNNFERGRKKLESMIETLKRDGVHAADFDYIFTLVHAVETGYKERHVERELMCELLEISIRYSARIYIAYSNDRHFIRLEWSPSLQED